VEKFKSSSPTTINKYRKHMKRWSTWEDVSKSYALEQASVDETLEILGNIKDKYGDHIHEC